VSKNQPLTDEGKNSRGGKKSTLRSILHGMSFITFPTSEASFFLPSLEKKEKNMESKET